MLNKYSRRITQDESQPASQAMLYALGLSESDLAKPQVGIVSTGYEGNPCNMHLNDLAKEVKTGVQEAGALGLIFHTIGVSDGIANGTEGMRYSLPSRDIIADSIEVVVNAQWYDAVIAVVGCDKNMPGSVIAFGRLNRPAIMVYGGTIRPGSHGEKKLDIVSAFEALGEKFTGNISPDDFKAIIQKACPGPGACGGMYTANTMASSLEAMGIALPYSSSNPAESPDKIQECLNTGTYIYKLLELDLKPRDFISQKSIENALTTVMALGGSTNAVLHYLAIAHAFDLELSIDDVQRISDQTPFLADLKPSGQYVMEDLHQIGGTPGVLKYLLEKDFLHGDCLTVTGKSLAENLEDVPSLSEAQEIIHPVEKAIKKTGHIQILKGNLAEEGSVAKITGKEGEEFRGPARVYDGEFAMIKGVESGEIKAGEVVVIRYEGPRGAPGMPEMLKPTSAVMGAGLGKDIALITDGRFSGGSHGFVVGHVCPEAQEGGLIALIKNGDMIHIDARNKRIEAEIEASEIERRRKEWQAPELKNKQGILYKYAKLVSSASTGCVSDL